MRRLAMWVGGILAALLVLPVVLLLAANSGPGRRAIEGLATRLTSGAIRLDGLSGRFPDALRISRVELRDPQGDYATIDDLLVDWSPLQLLHHRIVIDRLTASHVVMLRMPAGSSGGAGLSAPVIVREFRVARLDTAAGLLGASASVALEGSGELASPTDGHGSLRIHELDRAANYAVAGRVDAAQVTISLQADEPVRGLLARLASLPDIGALTLHATLAGPRRAANAHVALTAGDLQATLGGTLDLERDVADLTVSAITPAMRPRPDIGWQAATVDAHVHGPFTHPNADGHLSITELTAAGTSIGELTADITGNAGQLRLDGKAAGLRIPGPNADLLAATPIVIEADARLEAPDRPVHVMLRHSLFTADATALTGAQRRLDASLRLADLVPLTAMAQVQARGDLALNLHAALQRDTTTLAADGTLDITGGQQQVTALIGENGQFSLTAAFHDDEFTLSQLRFAGHAASLDAHGKIAANMVDLSWMLAVDDLTAAAPQLNGQLHATGSVTGTTDDLSLIADIGGSVAPPGMSSGALTARIEAHGLPNNASGHISASGDLLGAPMDFAVALRRDSSGLAIDVDRATWKSLKAVGNAQLDIATMLPTGDLHITMTRLADLTPLLGRPIAGSVKASLSMPSGSERSTLDARIDTEGLQVGRIVGNLHASASGTVNALGVTLGVDFGDLHGAPARLSTAATVDVAQRAVTLTSLQADRDHQTVRLLAPAHIALGDGVVIDRLRLGSRQAVLELSGRVNPSLDLTASLRNLPADLFGADGNVTADARITGTPAQPTGDVRLAATGLRLRSGPGRAMPPAAIDAKAELAGNSARIDARVAAGGSHISLVGRAPLNISGALDLRAGGAIDLGLLDRILAAGGRRIRGQLTFDGNITGKVAAPNVTGSARLSGGEVQDYASGLHLRDIVAQVTGTGTALRITQMTAKAGQGTITATGSIAIAAPGVPLDLSIQARNAQPLANDMITAIIDADVALHGEALGQLAASGSVHVQRAELRIPDRMPASIAVLPVRQPGNPSATPPAAAPAVALDVMLTAPGHIFLRGRGVGAEFGGAVRLGGTTVAPRTAGGLDLRRGSISLAGRSLDFTEGRIGFTGGSITDPALHLVATSTSGGVSATLTIGGTAQEPMIALSSVPALPQDEVLAHLLFGSGVGRLGVFEVAQIATGLATLTGAGGIGDPLDKVRQGLGLDRLAVGNGASGSPTLEAGRYIAPRVYLGAKQTASGGTQANVQVDITKGLKLEATAGTGSGSATGTTGTSDGSSIGLTYQLEY